MGMIWWHSSLSFFYYYASFPKIRLRFWPFSTPMCIIKPSLGLYRVYDNKSYTFLIWGIFCGSCSQQKELALVIIGIRDQFRLGGRRSVARIFSPLLARKSSGFAQILQDFFIYFFAENRYLKNSRAPPPPPRTPMLVMRKCLPFLIIDANSPY